MDERWFLDVISGQRRGPLAASVRGILSLLTPLYGAGVIGRNRLFDLRLKRTHVLEVPIVSVGNLTTGGTGKTPFVAWLAAWFRNKGLAPCLVSRGYRALEAGNNDEYRVLAQLCPDVPHEQNRDRVAAARAAISKHAPDVLILDDGFQHRRLGRDVDIVLIDALNPWGYGRMLPRGLLREPPSALSRADAVIVTRADQVTADERSQLGAEIRRRTSAIVAEVAFRPQRLVDAQGRTAALESLAGVSLLGFCGIGNPAAFDRTLSAAGFVGVSVRSFPDHHRYSAGDLRAMEVEAVRRGAAALVTTQKDLVKLAPEWLNRPTWAIVIEAEVLTGSDDLSGLLAPLCHPRQTETTGTGARLGLGASAEWWWLECEGFPEGVPL